HELRPVGVEAPRERLVAHLLVALDVALDVARGQRPQLRHQKRDQAQLSDEFVGVVRHVGRAYKLDARLAAPQGTHLLEAWQRRRTYGLSPARPKRSRLGRDLGSFEMLVRGAVIAIGQRRALA